ncbi:TetR/AcrR family transcriptional regulator [Nocardioides marinquilinus]|uniref:TetR/AcrR family transcriptional regulator n=1 Tax=Nocardioides marinquilinus TaxID=1210400 RepID=A0ABP9PG06_9ACTN
MPRLIDHDQRRAELAEACWRVIAERGVGAVSVRTVAAEAGVSVGSLRHVLPTKGGLLAAAMRLCLERATARFAAHSPDLRTRADAINWLTEMLPLDAERRLEMTIHLALAAEAAGHPELASLRAAPDDAVRSGCEVVLRTCAAAGLLRDGLDLDAETTLLHVLLDGLAFHLLGPAARLSDDAARAILDAHLAARWA